MDHLPGSDYQHRWRSGRGAQQPEIVYHAVRATTDRYELGFRVAAVGPSVALLVTTL
jgi:hypothetical protein